MKKISLKYRWYYTNYKHLVLCSFLTSEKMCKSTFWGKISVTTTDQLKLPLFGTVFAHSAIKNVMVWQWIDQKSGGFLIAFVCTTWKKCSDFCTIFTPEDNKTLIKKWSKVRKKIQFEVILWPLVTTLFSYYLYFII